MLRFENVATPAVAATVAVPASVPPPGFVAIATVTFAVKLVTVLPSPSSTVTCTAGVIAAPATALVGSPVNTSALADPADTLNVAAPPVARRVPLALSVQPVPARLIPSIKNVATPVPAAPVAVPQSVPPPVAVPLAPG